MALAQALKKFGAVALAYGLDSAQALALDQARAWVQDLAQARALKLDLAISAGQGLMRLGLALA